MYTFEIARLYRQGCWDLPGHLPGKKEPFSPLRRYVYGTWKFEDQLTWYLVDSNPLHSWRILLHDVATAHLNRSMRARNNMSSTPRQECAGTTRSA